MKKLIITFVVFLIGGSAVLYAQEARKSSYILNYKMTVTVETPEGDISGSAVRVISNSSPVLRMPDVGNPAGVRGEAVVVDLGARGVLFALISHHSDNEFYNAFPIPGNKIGNGGSSPKGIAYYADLPIGTTGTIQPKYFPGYPKFVTFTDMDDPKSVTLAQVWGRDRQGYYELKEDHMEELFGEGVTLKEITLEITDEPVTWGVVDKWLPLEAKKLNMTYNYFSWPEDKN